jgi:hypothetical protein
MATTPATRRTGRCFGMAGYGVIISSSCEPTPGLLHRFLQPSHEMEICPGLLIAEWYSETPIRIRSLRTSKSSFRLGTAPPSRAPDHIRRTRAQRLSDALCQGSSWVQATRDPMPRTGSAARLATGSGAQQWVNVLKRVTAIPVRIVVWIILILGGTAPHVARHPVDEALLRLITFSSESARSPPLVRLYVEAFPSTYSRSRPQRRRTASV